MSLARQSLLTPRFQDWLLCEPVLFGLCARQLLLLSAVANTLYNQLNGTRLCWATAFCNVENTECLKLAFKNLPSKLTSRSGTPMMFTRLGIGSVTAWDAREQDGLHLQFQPLVCSDQIRSVIWSNNFDETFRCDDDFSYEGFFCPPSSCFFWPELEKATDFQAKKMIGRWKSLACPQSI